MDNQSSLLHSQIVNNNVPNTFDDVPIGGGTKIFNFSEYPEQEGQLKVPPPKKNVVRKAPKKATLKS